MAKSKKATTHIVTAEDLEKNPDLVDQGVKVGDEIEVSGEAPKKAEGKLPTIPSDVEPSEPLKEGSAKKVTPPRVHKKEFYTFKSRVKHDGNYYEKGDQIDAKDPLVKIFLESDSLE